jgi:hypothetical protein
MERLIWKKEAGDIGSKIQITKKILNLDRFGSNTILTTKTDFYAKCSNMKVVDDFSRVLESTRTQISRVCM